MQKNLKISFILLLVFSSLIIGFEQLVTFLGGFSLVYVAELIISAVLLYFVVRDVATSSRMKDLYGISFLFLVWETFLFLCVSIFSWFPRALYVLNKVVIVLALLFLIYILFRVYYELTHKKYSFIEVVLGNEHRVKKANKELSNGSLSAKPKKKNMEAEQNMSSKDSDNNNSNAAETSVNEIEVNNSATETNLENEEKSEE